MVGFRVASFVDVIKVLGKDNNCGELFVSRKLTHVQRWPVMRSKKHVLRVRTGTTALTKTEHTSLRTRMTIPPPPLHPPSLPHNPAAAMEGHCLG